jgi:type IV pilus assembly protein PilN
MIRINLLAAERERGRSRSWFPGQQKITVVCCLILAGTAAGLGWWYWSLGRASAQLDLDLVAAGQEAQRLRGLIQQVQQFDQRKAQLQQRVALIEELRKGQSGPVRMIDQISRSLPEGLWLTTLRQDGAAVTMDGRCITLTALSDFVANLSASGFFTAGVELVDSQVEAGVPGAGTAEIIRFTVRGQMGAPGGQT